jgi:hypothetical protein
MDKKYLLSLVSGLLLVPAVSQADYFTEFELSHTQVETESDEDEADSTLNQASGTFYFKNVATKDIPLAEAAFLNQASNVSLAYGQGDVEYKSDYSSETIDEDLDVINISGELFIPSASLYIAANYAKEDTEWEHDGEKWESSVKNRGIALGGIIGDNTIVYASYDKTSLDSVSLKRFGPNVKAVIPFSNGQGINLEGSIHYLKIDANIDDDSGYTLAFKGDYYLSRKVGLGIHWAYEDVADIKDYAFGFQGSVFITENIALEGSYTFQTVEDDDYDDWELDIDTLDISAKVRF